jgi:hypothetical protein
LLSWLLVVGAGPVVSLDVEVDLTPMDFSIRSFEPADYLMLCRSLPVRDRQSPGDRLVAAGNVTSARVRLSLTPWSRRAGAIQRELPFLAELEIRGIYLPTPGRSELPSSCSVGVESWTPWIPR